MQLPRYAYTGNLAWQIIGVPFYELLTRTHEVSCTSQTQSFEKCHFELAHLAVRALPLHVSSLSDTAERQSGSGSR